MPYTLDHTAITVLLLIVICLLIFLIGILLSHVIQSRAKLKEVINTSQRLMDKITSVENNLDGYMGSVSSKLDELNTVQTNSTYEVLSEVKNAHVLTSTELIQAVETLSKQIETVRQNLAGQVYKLSQSTAKSFIGSLTTPTKRK